MERLSNPSYTAQIIRKYEFRFQKRFGQNFLVDANILGKICEAAEIGKDDMVIEIGPGIGSLTQCLAEAAGSVIAIEIDKKLIPILEETLSGCSNVRIINEDVLKTDLKKLIEEYGKGQRIKLVANLPYYITTPIVMGILEQRLPIESMTIMIQKEVAERMQAEPGSKDYGALSLAVRYYAKVRVIAAVPPGCFMPRPKVASAVIRLDLYEDPPYRARDEVFLFKLIRAAFHQRRKTLQNALSNSSEIQRDKERIIAAISGLGLDASIRGERLGLSEFIALSDLLGNEEG